MDVDELRKVVPDLVEDLAHNGESIEAYQSFGYPNNGFSEFRLFQGKLFYIRITITSSDNAQLLLSSFVNKYGPPDYKDHKEQGDRYMWRDPKAVLALSVYPFYMELRIKCLTLEKEIREFNKADDNLDEFIDQGLKEIFKDRGATMEEKQKIYEIKKAGEKE